VTGAPSRLDPERPLRRIPCTNTEILADGNLADGAWPEHYRSRVSASKPAAPKPAPSEAAAGSISISGSPPSESPSSGGPASGRPVSDDRVSADDGGGATEPSDPELVARMVQGDRSAVALLYERHKLPLFALARGMLRSAAEAEDLLHDVFLEAWRRSADYSPERGSVRAWLVLRARSRALDRIKSAGRRPSAERDAAHDPPATAATPLETVDQSRLRELLARMPEPQQQVVLLGYFEGLSSVEISERLQIPVGTVKSRTRAALEALRDVLGKGHD
jgi:RNA polymerase sigma-70 factor (ECF subfamily)